MLITELNPFIRYARTHCSYYVRSQTSVCYDCRLFFLVNGAGVITLNNVQYELTEGTAIFLPPATRYHFSFQDSEKFRLIVLNFDLTQQNSHLEKPLSTVFEDKFDPAKVPPHDCPEELTLPIILNAPTLYATMRQCPELFIEQELFYREKVSSLVRLCLLELLRNTVDKELNPILCEQVLQYVHKNCTSGDITNQEIANIFGYHPHYLSSLVRRHTGKSLHQYVISYRLRLAKNLLLTTAMNVEEIAWRSGFCSASHFIKIFRDHNGITPYIYRQNHLRTDL